MKEIFTMGINYDKLPKNEDGIPEYASYCLTIDGRIPNRGNQVIDKFVASTQSAEETLDNLFSYYKEDFIREMDDTLEIIGRGYNAPAIYIYTTAIGAIQIVFSASTLYWLIADENFGNGSLLAAMEKVKGLTAAVVDQAAANKGEVPPLNCLILEYGKASSEQPSTEETGTDDLGLETARAILSNLPEDQIIELANMARRMNELAEEAAANTSGE